MVRKKGEGLRKRRTGGEIRLRNLEGFCSSAVLNSRAGHTTNVLSPLISVILIDSFMMSPVHVSTLSIQAVRGLPHLHAPVIIPFIISFYASLFALTVVTSSFLSPAFLRTHTLVFFAVYETHSIFCISKESRCLTSFFLSVQLSQPYVATGTGSFISRIFIKISML